MHPAAPGTVPEDSFRVEGHCCAITLPGVKESPEGIDFQPTPAVRAYLAALHPDAPSAPAPSAADGDSACRDSASRLR